jgi:hypothetical protein
MDTCSARLRLDLATFSSAYFSLIFLSEVLTFSSGVLGKFSDVQNQLNGRVLKSY